MDDSQSASSTYSIFAFRRRPRSLVGVSGHSFTAKPLPGIDNISETSLSDSMIAAAGHRPQLIPLWNIVLDDTLTDEIPAGKADIAVMC